MNDKNKKIIIWALIAAGVAGLVYYLFFSSKAPAKNLVEGVNLTQAQALEMSKTISNLIETESEENIAKANELKNELQRAGWIYLSYNNVRPA